MKTTLTWTVPVPVGEGSREGSTRGRGVAVVAAAAAVLCAALLSGTGVASAAGLPAAASGGSWGKAEELPGTVTHGTAGAWGQVSVVSCASAGNCGAGGYYTDARGHSQAFVVSERSGRWGKAEEVPGTAALNKGNAAISSVSCASTGYCAAGGFFTRGRGYQEAFVVSRRNGRWGKAEEVPGTAALNAGGNAQVTSVSCAPGGDCFAGGFYTDRSKHSQAFVVSENKDRWHAAQQVPGLAVLNVGASAQIRSVSCVPGGCAAGGFYTDAGGHAQAFVVSERNGRWGTAQEVPGMAALNVGGNARVTSVSCASAGNCAAGGFYQTTAADDTGGVPDEAFVVNERNARWETAEEVPGTAALNASGQNASVNSVSCPSAGNCAAGGFYTAGSGPWYPYAFVVTEKNGRWRTAQGPPGRALAYAMVSGLSSVSCPSAGNCAAAGFYQNDTNGYAAFVVTEKNGRWSTAHVPPGLAPKDSGADAVSCSSAGNCAVGGWLGKYGWIRQPFVGSERRGLWRKAEEVPGIAAVNRGLITTGSARVDSLSCASAGSCDVGGSYQSTPLLVYDGIFPYQAFVASEKDRRWAKAEEVRGTVHQYNSVAQVSSVSCGSAGNCGAGGFDNGAAFVASEHKGRWGTAVRVPGTAALSVGGDARISSVSCRQAVNCGAGGFYTAAGGHSQAFVVSARNGRWGTAVEVPGTAALNADGDAVLGSVSCGSAGNCGAGGFYTDAGGHSQAFVVTEKNGRWAVAQEVPGTAALNAGGDAVLSSVSCSSAGNCGAGGLYTDAGGHSQAFVVTEKNGRWGTAVEVPGTAAPNAGGDAVLSSVSCASAGNCGAGGSYTDAGGHSQAFVVTEKNGRWAAAVEVPGTAALNRGGKAAIVSVSCASAGNCGAGGSFTDAGGHSQAFVVIEKYGRWGRAEEVPGTAALNKGGKAAIVSVSCPSAGSCVVVGSYASDSGHSDVFVVSETR